MQLRKNMNNCMGADRGSSDRLREAAADITF